MPAERPYVLAMTPRAGLITADELVRMHIPDKRVELVRGVLVVREPAGGRHGRITVELTRRLANHVAAHGLGAVYAAETGFKIARHPDTVRAPDIAFVRWERLSDPEPAGFLNFAPDLAVEVLSPDDRPGEVSAKVAEWLSAGTRRVWVVDPERRLTRVFRDDGTEQIVTANQTLDGEEVVTGFSLPLASVL